MKLLFRFSFLLLFFSSAALNAQTWLPTAGGVTGGDVRAMAVYNGELYVGGQFNSAGGVPVNFIARWNGIAWDSVGAGLSSGSGVYSMQVYAGELYVGGSFLTAGGVSVANIAKWNGSIWSNVGFAIGGAYGFTIQGGDLYVCCGLTGGSNVYKYNGTTWSPIGTARGYTPVSIASHNGILYICGEKIEYWDGTTWLPNYWGNESSMGIADNQMVKEYNGDLFLGGDLVVVLSNGLGSFTQANGIAILNDTAASGEFAWYPFGGGTSSLRTTYDIAGYNGQLFAGGSFPGTDKLIKKWSGIQWDALGTPPWGGLPNRVEAIVEYKGDLYIGGVFGMNIGGAQANVVRYHEDAAGSFVCYGTCTGTAAVNPSFGIPPYTYSWDISAGGQTTAIATSLCAGSYVCSVTDSIGVMTNYTAIVTQPAAPLYSSNDTLVVCDSGCVTLTSTATGGVAPYAFYWDTYELNTTACVGSDSVINGVLVDVAGCQFSIVSTILAGAVPTAPTVSPTGPLFFCPGDSVNLSSSTATSATNWLYNGNFISGETGVSTWANLPGQYSIAAISAMGCTDTSLSVVINQYLDCDTWPGDANNDLLVDNNDFLEIGLHYGQTGLMRSGGVSNLWQAWASTDWGVTQTNGQDIKHVDCNGDGLIDDNDTLAININFSLTHTFVPTTNDERLTTPEIYLVTSSSTYLPGDWVDAEVWLGTSTVPVSNLYGIAFNIEYDASIVQSGSESLIYPNSWLGNPGIDAIKLSKIDGIAAKVYGAETRIDHINSNGFGKIANFKFQLKNTISTSDSLNINIAYYNAVDSVGNPIVFNTQNLTLHFSSVGINEFEENNEIVVYPNPYQESTQLYYSLKGKSNVVIEIFNTIGQKIETIVNTSQNAGEYKYTFSAKEKGYDAGIYFVKFTIDGKTTMRKIVEVK